MRWTGVKREVLRTLRGGEEPIWNLPEPKGGWGWTIRALKELMAQGLVEQGKKRWPGASEHHDLSTKANTYLGADCFRLTQAGHAEAGKIRT